ncbi:desulfoferrodoxin family protein [Methanolobus sp.]|uniref:desulfoferrodoxin family protein n=1 Tax=Methanolobus sp. TaxID=1874737 RepID=UPI0025E0F155|nr:desulfoferrodoxin family protein [Methanolobus sp.]
MTLNANQRIKDYGNLNDSEKTHAPVIVAPDEAVAGEPFEVKVIIGNVPHVMDEEHYISQIELYLDENSVGKVEFKPTDGVAETVFEVAGTEDMIAAREIRNCTVHGFGLCGACGTRSAIVKITAVVTCNVHGTWEDSRGIEIISALVKSGKKCNWGPQL